MTSDLQGKSVLITGAAGCIGAWVVKKLIDIGATPVVFDLSDNRSRLNLIMDGADSVTWEIGDITDFTRVQDVMAKHKIYAVIHLAALQVPFCKADPVGSTKVNVLGTTHIFEAVRQAGIKRLTYASSIAAPAMGENHFLATLYGAHKVCGEQMAAVYWQDWQVPSVCIRPGVIYGPGRDQGMSAAPTIAILAALMDNSYTVPFSGPVAFVHAEDAADRFIRAVSTNVSSAHVFDMQGTAANISDVVSEIKNLMKDADVRFTGSALPFPYAPDDGRLDILVGAPPYRTMQQGIADTLSVFKTAQNRGILTDDLAKNLIEKNS